MYTGRSRGNQNTVKHFLFSMTDTPMVTIETMAKSEKYIKLLTIFKQNALCFNKIRHTHTAELKTRTFRAIKLDRQIVFSGK